MPHPSQDQHSSYAKNVTIADSLPDKTLDASQLSASLQNSFNPIVNWAEQNHLTIAPSKSSVTLFTPWTKQFNAQPRVTCQNTELPREKTPKILGVTLDPSFTFTPHAKSIATKCQPTPPLEDIVQYPAFSPCPPSHLPRRRIPAPPTQSLPLPTMLRFLQGP